MEDLLDIYDEVRVCEYKGRRYLVRNNGAVCRLPKEDGRISKWDNVWTFGTKREDNGYMYLTGNISIHQIVCTAFHGEPEYPQMIVDHIDTNRCNNRPKNLRWITKLENILNNPITRAKVELICGSIPAFLENPSLLFGHESEDNNFSWMRTVSKEEAERSLKRWNEWAAKPIEERMPKGQGVGEFLFSEEQEFIRSWNGGKLIPDHKPWPQQKAEIEAANLKQYEADYGLKDSLTPGAKQLNWKTPTEFLLCPTEGQERTLQLYLDNLVKGKVFTRTQYGDGGVVLDCGINEAENALYVLTQYGNNEDDQRTVKPWALCKITLQNGFFVHENRGSFFQEDGGIKRFTLAMGREWDGGEVYDDSCPS